MSLYKKAAIEQILEAISYEGEIDIKDENQKPHEFVINAEEATVEYENKRIYKGAFKENKHHGEGEL